MNLDLNADGGDYKLRLPEFCGETTYPMVFVAGELVGTLADTKALFKANKDMKKYVADKMKVPQTRAVEIVENKPVAEKPAETTATDTPAADKKAEK